jgi:phosphoserine phosphatase
MSIALFLDVDRTLTVDTIQHHYAGELGCVKEYNQIEARFQESKLTASAFGDELIALFAKRGFTLDRAAPVFDRVELRANATELLQLHQELPVEVYLVSSGPCYYVQELATRHGIPLTNVLCSRYTFKGPGGVISSCNAASGHRKRSFVQKHRNKRLTIGIGDSETADAEFLGQCTISLLNQPNDTFASIPSLWSAEDIVESLCGTRFRQRSGTPRLFIGCSTDVARDFARYLVEQIEGFCEPVVWDHDTFEVGDTPIESLERALEDHDFAAFIFAPDDTVESRGDTAPAVRDNVLFEFGLFCGRLGRARCFIIEPSDVKLKIPSDLLPVTRLQYNSNRARGDFRASTFGAAANRIRERVEELGPFEVPF